MGEKKHTEFEKMVSGEVYNQADMGIVLKMAKAHLLVTRLNKVSLIRQSKRTRLLKRLLGSLDGEPYFVASPIYIQYGVNTHIGKNFVSNYNFVLMDAARIDIGDDVMIAPNVIITTELHPIYHEDRIVHWTPHKFPSNNKGDYEYAKPVTIGNRVWICSNVTVCPGVTIGENSVIGAGSVVTRDIPPNVFACGVPCKAVREITKDKAAK